MIVGVEVQIAIRRPLNEDETVYLAVEADSEVEGELIACQLAVCNRWAVMPLRSTIIEIFEI